MYRHSRSSFLRSSALAATPACRLDPATLPIPSPNGSPLVGRVCKVNNSAPPASLLSEASMLPCPVLMVSAEPYLLFPVITGNSGPGQKFQYFILHIFTHLTVTKFLRIIKIMLSVINGKVFLFSVFAVFAVFALFVQFSEFAFYLLYLICITFCVLFFCEKKVRKNAFRRSFML